MRDVKAIREQRGLSLVGFLLVLVLVVIVVLLGLKIVPIYTEYYSVVQAMQSLRDEENIELRSPMEIEDLFFRRLYINYVDSVDRNEVLVSRRNGLHIRVKYEVRESIVGNLDVVAEFDKTVSLTDK